MSLRRIHAWALALGCRVAAWLHPLRSGDAAEVLGTAETLGAMAYMTCGDLLETNAYVRELLVGPAALRLTPGAPDVRRAALTRVAQVMAVARFREYVQTFGRPTAESRQRLRERIAGGGRTGGGAGSKSL